MKTRFFLIAGMTMIILTCQNTQAQFSYGLHAGMNLETQASLGQLWNNCELYQGYLAGGFLEYGFNKTLSLQTEINYQKKGEKTVNTESGIKSVNRREFNYISVPLLVKFYVHDGGLGDKWDVSFLTGPYAGFLTSANSKIKAGDTTTPVKIDNQAEKTDIGAVIGTGVRYRLESGHAILAELRYEMGLTRIDATDTDLRNKGIGLTIGFSF
jgi:hypothetical protein